MLYTFTVLIDLSSTFTDISPYVFKQINFLLVSFQRNITNIRKEISSLLICLFLNRLVKVIDQIIFHSFTEVTKFAIFSYVLWIFNSSQVSYRWLVWLLNM